MVSWKGSLFNYFFASCWLNFQDRGLDLHPSGPRDLWENDKLAILANRRFCLDHASPRGGGAGDHYATYGDAAWGLTACDRSRPSGLRFAERVFLLRGAAHRGKHPFRDPAAPGRHARRVRRGQLDQLRPPASIAALRHYFQIPGLWSPLFGFGDAFSLDPHYLESPYDTEGNPTVRFAGYLNGPWVNPMVMGINAGPMLLAIENYRSGLLWGLTSRNPEIKRGLDSIFGAGSPRVVHVSVDPDAPNSRVTLRWESSRGAARYNIYSSTDLQNWTLLKRGLSGTNWTDTKLAAGLQRFYQVKGLP